jgi:surfeit locus 1 family protein
MNLSVRINWKVTLFSLFFLGVFLRLGFWQIERADEKEFLIERQQAATNEPPASLVSVVDSRGAADGERVSGFGRYDVQDIYLLDNRVLEGKVGFEVLHPFLDEASQTWFLVNRGFVPMGRTRDDAPDIPALVSNPQTVIGRIYLGGKNASAGLERVAEKPFGTIVQAPDTALVAMQRGEEFHPHFPFLVRLEEHDQNALPRHWPVTVMSPAKHRGYAAQWFTMALAVMIAWAAFTFRR